MSILAEILSSRIRAEIFRMLFGLSEKPLHMREIERRSGFTTGTVQQELKKLLRLDLIKKEKNGNRVYYQANCEHPLYFDIRNIVLKTIGLADIFRDVLCNQPDIKFAFVFGSVARKEEKSLSDVDLMVLGNISLRTLTGLLSGISGQIEREINPYVLTFEEFLRKKTSGDHFISQVLESPKIFIAGNEHDLTAMG
ncbi:MAG: nucleotidyltransferase domain-containing protein [Desulfobacterales bacterium]